MSLYKGRYLIAIYDKDDNFIECGTNLRKFALARGETIRTRISRNQLCRHREYNIFLIDCLEKHDDIFAEEDEIFLKEEKNIKGKDETYREIAKRLGKSLRTIKRYAQKGLIKV